MKLQYTVGIHTIYSRDTRCQSCTLFEPDDTANCFGQPPLPPTTPTTTDDDSLDDWDLSGSGDGDLGSSGSGALGADDDVTQPPTADDVTQPPTAAQASADGGASGALIGGAVGGGVVVLLLVALTTAFVLKKRQAGDDDGGGASKPALESDETHESVMYDASVQSGLGAATVGED